MAVGPYRLVQAERKRVGVGLGGWACVGVGEEKSPASYQTAVDLALTRSDTAALIGCSLGFLHPPSKQSNWVE